jgi:hypothetical protein
MTTTRTLPLWLYDNSANDALSTHLFVDHFLELVVVDRLLARLLQLLAEVIACFLMSTV